MTLNLRIQRLDCGHTVVHIVRLFRREFPVSRLRRCEDGFAPAERLCPLLQHFLILHVVPHFVLSYRPPFRPVTCPASRLFGLLHSPRIQNPL